MVELQLNGEQSVFKRFKANVALNRRAEEALYSLAYDEYESGNIRKGLWAQALAQAEGGGAEAAKAFYLRLRVQALKDEINVMDYLNDQQVATEKLIDSGTILEDSADGEQYKTQSENEPLKRTSQELVESPSTAQEATRSKSPQSSVDDQSNVSYASLAANTEFLNMIEVSTKGVGLYVTYCHKNVESKDLDELINQTYLNYKANQAIKKLGLRAAPQSSGRAIKDDLISSPPSKERKKAEKEAQERALRAAKDLKLFK
jgi:hypothetical protein